MVRPPWQWYNALMIRLVRRGSQFGPQGSDSLTVTYGVTGKEYAASNCSVVKPHTEIHCVTTAGVGGNLRWIVNVANLSSETPTTSYGIPEISAAWMFATEEEALSAIDAFDVSGLNTIPTQGDGFLLLEGDNFGRADEFIDESGNALGAINYVEYGKLNVPVETLRSGGYLTGCSNKECSCDDIFNAAKDYAADREGFTLSLLTSWKYSADDCHVVQDHTHVLCRFQPGVGNCLHVRLSVEELTSEVSSASVSYASPLISSVTVQNDPFGPTLGDVDVNIVGMNLAGPVARDVAIYFGYDENSDLQPIQFKNIKTVSHTELIFRLPGGQGTNLPIEVHMGGQVSPVYTGFSFTMPEITEVRYVNGSVDRMPDPFFFRIRGRNFARCCVTLAYFSNSPALTTPECRCHGAPLKVLVYSEYANLGQSRCLPQSTGTAVDISLHEVGPSTTNEREDSILISTVYHTGCYVITAGGQVSAGYLSELTTLVPPPVVGTLMDGTGATDPKLSVGSRLTILGSNFGDAAPRVSLLYDMPEDLKIEGPPVRSIAIPMAAGAHSALQLDFTVPPGHGQAILKVAIPTGNSSSSLFDEVVFRYKEPVITAAGILPAALASSVRASLTAGTEQWQDLVRGYFDASYFYQSSSSEFENTYSRPSGCLRYTTEGDGLFVLKGNDLGVGEDPLERRITVGTSCPSRSNPWEKSTLDGVVCEAQLVGWSSEYVIFEIPEGQGKNLAVKYELFMRSRSLSIPFLAAKYQLNVTYFPVPASVSICYLDPQITGVFLAVPTREAALAVAGRTTHGSPDGEYSIVIRGNNFGSLALDSPQRRVSILSRRVLVITAEHTGFWYFDPIQQRPLYVSTSSDKVQHRYILVQTPKGVGAGLPLEVSVDTAVAYSTFTYDLPVVYGANELSAVTNEELSLLGSAARDNLALRKSLLSLIDSKITDVNENFTRRALSPRDLDLWEGDSIPWDAIDLDAEEASDASDGEEEEERQLAALALPGITHPMPWSVPQYIGKPEYERCAASSSVCLNAMGATIRFIGEGFQEGDGISKPTLRLEYKTSTGASRETISPCEIVNGHTLNCVVTNITASSTPLSWRLYVSGQVISSSSNQQSFNFTAQCPTGTFEYLPAYAPADMGAFIGTCRSCAPDNPTDMFCSGCTSNSVRCFGGGYPPLANNGAWLVASEVGFRSKRCAPSESCAGNNTCNVGYSGGECSECSLDFSRNLITNKCAACPDSPGVKLAFLGVAVLLVVLILQLLYRNVRSPVAITIAIDHLQVLSVFSSLDLNWPDSLITSFRAASSSASNVEVFQPSCSFSVTYYDLWYLLESLPLTLFAASLIAHVFIIIGKFCQRHQLLKEQNRSISLTRHYSTIIGMYLTVLNFLYIMLAKKGFEVLDCTDLDGSFRLTADASVPCEGEQFELLQLLGTFALIGYGIGIPLLFGTLLHRHRNEIRVDQALRLRGLAESRTTTPFWDTQKRLRRLYFRFKPSVYYWSLIALFKKAAILVVAFVFRGQPSLAAASVTLVLFSFFALQVQCKPYRHREEKLSNNAAVILRNSQGEVFELDNDALHPAKKSEVNKGSTARERGIQQFRLHVRRWIQRRRHGKHADMALTARNPFFNRDFMEAPEASPSMRPLSTPMEQYREAKQKLKELETKGNGSPRPMSLPVNSGQGKPGLKGGRRLTVTANATLSPSRRASRFHMSGSIRRLSSRKSTRNLKSEVRKMMKLDREERGKRFGWNQGKRCTCRKLRFALLRYNLVETVVQACAIAVMLLGLLFRSADLEES